MEREGPKNFSIEPYVDGGGLMGNQIEVDQKAASSIMRRTALRRDVLVSKGYFREVREFEGDEEIAISTARVHNARQEVGISRSGYSTLVKNPEVWQIQIHDQQIADRVDQWMAEHYSANGDKSGEVLNKEKFVKEFKDEIDRRIWSAFLREKGEVFTSSVFRSGRYIIAGGFFLGSIYGLTRFEVEYNRYSHPEVLSNSETIYVYALVLSVGVSVGALGYIYEKDKDLAEDGLLKKWEYRLPNPQIPSIIVGSTLLVLNSRKLIRLKQKE